MHDKKVQVRKNCFFVFFQPELLDVQRRLAAQGLKDPWLRNQSWRYDQSQIKRPSMFHTVGRGLLPGLAIGLLLAGITWYRDSKRNHHDHGDHH